MKGVGQVSPYVRIVIAFILSIRILLIPAYILLLVYRSGTLVLSLPIAMN
jgi:hypothetical protein